MAFSSRTASFPESRTCRIARRDTSGFASSASSATPACTVIAVTVWATMSCSSRAIRTRSSRTRRAASRSRSCSARAALAAYSCVNCRLVRTTSPSSSGTSGQIISSSGNPCGLATSNPTRSATAPETSAATTPVHQVRRRRPVTATVYSATMTGRFRSSPMCPYRAQAAQAAPVIAATGRGRRLRHTSAPSETPRSSRLNQSACVYPGSLTARSDPVSRPTAATTRRSVARGGSARRGRRSGVVTPFTVWAVGPGRIRLWE